MRLYDSARQMFTWQYVVRESVLSTPIISVLPGPRAQKTEYIISRYFCYVADLPQETYYPVPILIAPDDLRREWGELEDKHSISERENKHQETLRII